MAKKDNKKEAEKLKAGEESFEEKENSEAEGEDETEESKEESVSTTSKKTGNLKKAPHGTFGFKQQFKK